MNVHLSGEVAVHDHSLQSLNRHTHKVLTYVEYRVVPGVFRTIDTPPPLHPASVSSPPPKAGGYTLAGR